VTDQARPAAGHLQGMIPPRIAHGEERSSLREVAKVVETCNLPELERSSPLNRQGRPLPGARHSRAHRTASIRCTCHLPAMARNPRSELQTTRRTAQLPISAE
jgi:hypothetical protein